MHYALRSSHGELLDHIVQKNAQIVIGKNTHGVIKSYNQAVLFPKGYI